MNKIFSLLLLSIFIFSCGSSNSSNSSQMAQEAKTSGTLIMGTSGVFPPFTHISSSGASGFDIEVGKIVARNYGKVLEIRVMNFDALLPALQNGNIDMIISAMSITDERKKIVDFSNTYYETSQAVIIRKDDYQSFANIITKEELRQQKSIAVERGATGASIVNAIYTSQPKDIIEGTSEEIIQKLLAKDVDVVVIDGGVAIANIATNDELMIYTGVKFDPEYYGIAVRKNQNELLDSINKTINEIVVSGDYNRLIQTEINEYGK